MNPEKTAMPPMEFAVPGKGEYTERIVCVDFQILGFDKAKEWMLTFGPAVRSNHYLVTCHGNEIGDDYTFVIGIAHSMIARPQISTPSNWVEAVWPAWLAFHHPECVDEYPLEEIMGAVSLEEFEESLFNATLRSDDPRWRD